MKQAAQRYTNKQTNHVTSIQNRLAEILRTIPPETWPLIVEKEPEWQHLEPLRPKFPQGSFSVFMMAVGLNAYQLKGKAEIAYWARLYDLLENCNSIPSLEALTGFLAKFYQKERLYNSKLDRLSRFMSSPLAANLWTNSAQDTSHQTIPIWQGLGNVMKQKLHEKTICFAMKCLGISLMMADVYDFDFQDIPIPVDSRITKFTKKLSGDIGENTRKIQNFWQGILLLLRSSIPEINMIHLDSIIWQIAHHETGELIAYFEELDISKTGRRLIRLLQDS
jgi:DNA-(apurinic or apyrimidinic site) lyase